MTTQQQQYKAGSPYENFQNDSTNRNEYTMPPSDSYMGTQPGQQPVQMNMGGVPQVVVQPNSSVQTFTVHTELEPWSWCHLVTSMIAFFCCTLFGFIATVMSILSYVDYHGKSYERFRAKKSCAYGFGITSIVLGSITFLVIIIVVATGGFELAQAINSASNNNQGGGSIFNGNFNSGN